jgi:hypothetical protein
MCKRISEDPCNSWSKNNNKIRDLIVTKVSASTKGFKGNTKIVSTTLKTGKIELPMVSG